MQFKIVKTKFLVKGSSQYSTIECVKHSFNEAKEFMAVLKTLGYTKVEVSPC